MSPCKLCGEERGEHLFLWVPDDIWEGIGMSPKDFLCAHCIIDELSKYYSYGYCVFHRKESRIQAALLKVICEEVRSCDFKE